MKHVLLSLALLATGPAFAASTDSDVCEHATYFSGCGEAWGAVRAVARIVLEQGCADSVVSPLVDTAAMEIRHCTRPQGIYDLPLAPVKSACAELAALRFRDNALQACRAR